MHILIRNVAGIILTKPVMSSAGRELRSYLIRTHPPEFADAFTLTLKENDSPGATQGPLSRASSSHSAWCRRRTDG